jgi:alkanesulfonate monooxygenase SsuD/methylene tetrahydromethanopterin reductase-like flavin-dependent oxidoreductase (luciferase family)
MISVIHDPVDEHDVETGDYPVPAGGRRMELESDRVAEVFREAVDRVGWDADLEIRPEKQYVLVRFASGSPERIADRIDDFYDVVEGAIGSEAFSSIWIDFSFLP